MNQIILTFMWEYTNFRLSMLQNMNKKQKGPDYSYTEKFGQILNHYDA